MIGDFLSRIPAGRVRTAFCADVAVGLSELQSWLDRCGPELRIAFLSRFVSPRIASAPTAHIDQMLVALAETAASVWPAWYGQHDVESALADISPEQLRDLLITGASDQHLHAVSRVWLEAAVDRLLQKRLPLPTGFPPPVQARQLGLAMKSHSLVFVYALGDSAPHRLEDGTRIRPGVRMSRAFGNEGGDADLAGVVGALEWLADNTSARVMLLAPLELRGENELERISYSAWVDASRRDHTNLGNVTAGPTLNKDVLGADALDTGGQDQQALAEEALDRQALEHEALILGGDDAQRTASEEEPTRYWPIVGRPSPFSSGEQLLAERLLRDPILAPLFGFNEWVETRFGSRYLVDLLWPAGRCVVEIDGYTYHSSRAAFASDRHRDFELAASGYLILRIPHAEVLEDVERALAKIRDIVATRKPTFLAMESK